MAFTIQRVKYYYTTVQDRPGEGYKVLSSLAERGINLLAFTAVPFGDNCTQLALFPENPEKMVREAKSAGLSLQGPHWALLVHGDDELGAFAQIHAKLFQAKVNVYASSGLTDDKGSYAYLLYLRPEDVDRAAEALGV